MHTYLLFALVLLASCSVGTCQHDRRDRLARVKGFAHFERVIVISLVRRQDRRALITRELHSVGVHTFDFLDAVETPCGPLGCTLSHIMAVQKCKDTRARTCLVLEDDFAFDQDPDTAVRYVNAFFGARISTDWDLIYLSSNVMVAKNTSNPLFLKVIDAQTTSGYAVNSHYYDELLHTYTSSAWLLNDGKCDAQSKSLFAIDIFMKRKQPFGNWFVMQPRLGKQRQGFSDIEKAVTDYKV